MLGFKVTPNLAAEFRFAFTPINVITTVLSRYNEVGYSEQLDIVNTFRLFGWLSVELMIENSGYSELGYNEYLVITNAFSQILRFFHSI